jgi:hypothetical protein
MRRAFPFILLAVTCIQAQSTGLVENTPDTVIAVVNGRKFTVGDLERILPSLPPNLQSLFSQKPKDALEQYALGEVLTQEAERLKLQNQEPYRQQLENARRQVLAQAVMKEKGEKFPLPAEDVRKYYDANIDNFRQAWVKIIFVGRAVISQKVDGTPAPVPDAKELKAKAELVTKQAREGQDFAALAKKYSDDSSTADKGGALPFPIRADLQSIPAELRDQVLKAETGSIIGPYEHQTGWYILRVDKLETAPFESVQAEIEKKMKDAVLKRWVEEMKTKSSVKMENQPFWDTFRESNKPQGGGQ